MVGEGKVTCVVCERGFYAHEEVQCRSGDIANCVVYINKEKCGQCSDKYYLSDD